MRINILVSNQYKNIVNSAQKNAFSLTAPPEGWLRTVRKAFKIPAKVIMSRAGITKSELFRVERAEVEGTLTLKKLQDTAQALGCAFHYAVVPNDTIESIIEKRAYQHARKLLGQANTHMQLEEQGVADDITEQQIKLVAQDLINEMPDWFWESE